MIISMTGFGKGEATLERRKVVVEARSINSRHLDVSLRLPSVMQPFELEVRELLRKKIARGKLSVSVSESLLDGSPVPLELSVDDAVSLTKQLREIAEASNITEPVTLRDLLYFNEWLIGNRSPASADAMKQALLTAIEAAIDDLIAMRLREGDTLRIEFERMLQQIQTDVIEIAKLHDGNAVIQKQRLEQRLIDAGLSPALIDPMRLTAEVALLVDRQNIAEEIARLKSHLDQFRKAIADTSAAGKRLNFLTQEMHREANTIASKSTIVEMIHFTVHIREAIEQLREQVQNVE
ncbi:MAG: YicC family protein [bacterium]|nr:YicC family protein [bacterium]